MSDLQIVLILIGGLIIAGVLMFNWWQERKFHQQIERNFSEFQPENPPAAADATLFSSPEPSTEHEFAIDPTRFEENAAVSAAESQHETTAADHHPLHSEAQLAPEPDATEEPVTAASQFSEPVEATQQVEAATSSKSAQHDEIKAIIQNAFEPITPEARSVEAASESESTAIVHEAVVGQLPDMLHSQVDWAALLYLQGTASAQDVAAAIKNDFSHYDKPTFIHVQTAQGWFLLSDITENAGVLMQPVSKVCCSIQLADRAGPIARSMINRFQLAVESLGLEINAHVEWQSAGDALTDATALDQFCIEVDKTMGFHLLHGDNGAFTGTKLRGLAEAQGMQLENDGTFKFFDETATQNSALNQPQFVMFNREHYPFNAEMLRNSVVKSITFQLDIPHVKNCVDAFNTMVQTAKQMETGLNAQLVDDNNRPLTDVQIEKIRHQLKIIQATMFTRGIAPGSACAHRLFS